MDKDEERTDTEMTVLDCIQSCYYSDVHINKITFSTSRGDIVIKNTNTFEIDDITFHDVLSLEAYLSDK
jgi:hypothetical protein